MVKRHHRLMLATLRLGDLGIALGAWCLAYAAQVLGFRLGLSEAPTQPFASLVLPIVLSLALTPLVFGRLGLYEPRRTKSSLAEALTVTEAVSLIWLITYATASFAVAAGLPRNTVGLALVIWLLLAVSNRMLTRAALRWFRIRGWNLRHAAIVGTGRLAQRLYIAFSRNRWTGVEIGYFIDNGYVRDELFGLDVVGPIEKADELVSKRPVDIVFVALPRQRHEDIESTLSRLAMTSVDVRMVPDLLFAHLLRHDVTQLDELAIVTLTHSPQHGWHSLMKRLVDLVVSIPAAAVFALPMAVIAAAIRLTGNGPVFYRQERTSLGGQLFKIIKFRTMRQNAEDKTGPVWTAPDDRRVTRVGRFLRRTSLDELPQLLNVLLGQMSLVGPRPERPELVEQFRRRIPGYMLRHQVKAGLTGWAQVHGLRGRTSLRKRVQYDLYYITNWSLGLDVRILLMTLLGGFIHRNAY